MRVCVYNICETADRTSGGVVWRWGVGGGGGGGGETTSACLDWPAAHQHQPLQQTGCFARPKNIPRARGSFSTPTPAEDVCGVRACAETRTGITVKTCPADRFHPLSPANTTPTYATGHPSVESLAGACNVCVCVRTCVSATPVDPRVLRGLPADVRCPAGTCRRSGVHLYLRINFVLRSTPFFYLHEEFNIWYYFIE